MRGLEPRACHYLTTLITLLRKPTASTAPCEQGPAEEIPGKKGVCREKKKREVLGSLTRPPCQIPVPTRPLDHPCHPAPRPPFGTQKGTAYSCFTCSSDPPTTKRPGDRTRRVCLSPSVPVSGSLLSMVVLHLAYEPPTAPTLFEEHENSVNPPSSSFFLTLSQFFALAYSQPALPPARFCHLDPA
jgi:hypothetical protein